MANNEEISEFSVQRTTHIDSTSTNGQQKPKKNRAQKTHTPHTTSKSIAAKVEAAFRMMSENE